MVFNATFNNISAISWQSVLLVEETGVPGENHHRVVSNTPHLNGIRTHNLYLTCKCARFETCVPQHKVSSIPSIDKTLTGPT